MMGIEQEKQPSPTQKRAQRFLVMMKAVKAGVIKRRLWPIACSYPKMAAKKGIMVLVDKSKLRRQQLESTI